MRFLRKIGIWLVTSVMLVATAALVACGKEEPKDVLTLDKTEISMLVADETTIEATYEERDGQTLAFASSDEAVVSVTPDGKVTANKKGSATITATYGKATATCAVTVSLGDMLPALELIEIDGDSASVMMGDTLNFASQVTFNGKTFTDATVTYSVENPEVATVSTEGVLTPVKGGTTNVTVTATWRGETGATLAKTVAVTVVNNVSLYVNDGNADEIVLYTAASFCGQTYSTESPFVAHAFENGAEKTPTVTFANGADEIVTFADGKITAVGVGETVATLSYTASDEQTYTEDVTVKVLQPEYTYATPVNFSAKDGYLPIAEIFAATDVTITSATEGETALTLDGNRITNIAASKTEILEKNVVLTTAEGKVNVTLKVYTKVLTQAADIAVFDLYETDTVIEGFYLLGNDIDASAIAPNTHAGYTTGGSSTNNNAGFKGVFDGNGHTLTINANTSGVFGRLLDGAVIKNVIMNVNNTVNQFNKLTPSAIAHTCENNAKGSGVKIENAYIKVVRNEKTVEHATYGTCIIGTRIVMLTLNNVVIENTGSTSARRGSMFYADGARNYDPNDESLKEAYDEIQARFDNVYVITDSKYVTQWGNETTEADGFINVNAMVAGNVTVDKNAMSLNGNLMQKYTGVKAYATYTELAADAGYASLPFTVTDGTVAWKA